MSNLLVDEQDQRFVLHEMLHIEELCETSSYGHLSRDVIDASLDAAQRLALKESYPIMVEADHEGCRLENGSAFVPRCYHRLKEQYDQGKFASAYIPTENGGLGFPLSLWTPLFEYFVHNLGFLWLWSSPFSGTNLILRFGSQEQKERYLPNLVSGKWGSTLACTEEQAGADDLAALTTTALKQPDGSYWIKGTKPTVTGGDSDLFENIVHIVLARIKGDAADASGLSLFIVPKYLANSDGSLGPRNDYSVAGLERKLGLHGSPTASINFGENGHCYAELLGERGKAQDMLISVVTKCPFYGIISTGIASATYLHSLDYTRKRIQGINILEANNPDAQRVAIIAQPFVRQRLLWMKSHVEGMRALIYYSCLCLDKVNSLSDPIEKEKWSGINDMLFPISRRYTADRGLKVTEIAIQMHGRYGFFSDYPVNQFMRDIIPIGWWEGDASANILFYLTQLMRQREGQDFANLLMEMNHTIEECEDLEGMKELAQGVHSRVNLLGEIGFYFANCFKEGKILVPLSNGMPFIRFMGDICVGWMLLWQAGIATKRLEAIFNVNDIDQLDSLKRSEFVSQNKEAAFYDGKLHSARYFIKNVLPQVDGIGDAIKSEDLSLMAIHDESF